MNGKVSLELIYHFRCGACNRWWTIADANTTQRKEGYCPWCGLHQQFDDTTPREVL